MHIKLPETEDLSPLYSKAIDLGLYPGEHATGLMIMRGGPVNPRDAAIIFAAARIVGIPGVRIMDRNPRTATPPVETADNGAVWSPLTDYSRHAGKAYREYCRRPRTRATLLWWRHVTPREARPLLQAAVETPLCFKQVAK